MKQKKETQTEPSSRKKKNVLTRDSMVNGISKKDLSVNRKVKIVNFPGDTSKKILEKLDDIIKEKPDDLMTNVKKIFNKTAKELQLQFLSVINRQDKTNTRRQSKHSKTLYIYECSCETFLYVRRN